MREGAKLNAIRSGVLGDDEYRVLNVPRVSVFLAAASNVAISTLVKIGWDTLVYDTDNMFDTANSTRITCKTPGLYLFTGNIGWASNATGYREMYYLKSNGQAYNHNVVSPGTGTVVEQSTSAQIPLNAGDYVEMACSQNGANPLALAVGLSETSMSACLISTL